MAAIVPADAFKNCLRDKNIENLPAKNDSHITRVRTEFATSFLMNRASAAAYNSKEVANRFGGMISTACSVVTNGNRVEMADVEEASAIWRLILQGANTNKTICVTAERLRSSGKHTRTIRIFQ
jgi:hypothetical protein